jgi:hypothetical protein
MDTPYWMCFECDHEQALGGPCEECGGSCHEVGDDEVDAAGLVAALRDGHLVEVYETDDLVEIVRLAKEWMAEPSFSEATDRVQSFTVGMVKQLDGGE